MGRREHALLGIAAVLMVAVSWSVALGQKDAPVKGPAAKSAQNRPLYNLDVTLGKVAKAIEAGDTKTALAELAKARAAVNEWRKSGALCARCAAAKAAAPTLCAKCLATGILCEKCKAAGAKAGTLCATCLKTGTLCAKCRAAMSPKAGTSLKPVNTKCPLMGSTIDPDKVPANLRRTFKGQVVGFCCAGCPAAWDKLSDAEKEAKLKAALAGTK